MWNMNSYFHSCQYGWVQGIQDHIWCHKLRKQKNYNKVLWMLKRYMRYIFSFCFKVLKSVIENSFTYLVIHK
jgi:hypothetical protein